VPRGLSPGERLGSLDCLEYDGKMNFMRPPLRGIVAIILKKLAVKIYV
jgi:hypothetical protein